jgi:peroxiredoxin
VIIGRDGRIEKIFPKVQIDGHVEEVEEEIRRINAAS